MLKKPIAFKGALQGTGVLQDFNIAVRYSITIRPDMNNPAKSEGLGELETLTGDPLPKFEPDQRVILTLQDGSQKRIQFDGLSHKFELFDE
jgi:hypothetical protein